jgi:hypothetical protein
LLLLQLGGQYLRISRLIMLGRLQYVCLFLLLLLPLSGHTAKGC